MSSPGPSSTSQATRRERIAECSSLPGCAGRSRGDCMDNFFDGCERSQSPDHCVRGHFLPGLLRVILVIRRGLRRFLVIPPAFLALVALSPRSISTCAAGTAGPKRGC
jgi:hypothetical protein